MTLLVTIACLGFVSLLRGVVGFATATVAVPILLDLGYSLSECVALLLTLSLIQSIAASFQLREQIPWKQVGQASIWRFLGLPCGISALFVIEQFDVGVVKALVGCFILLAIAAHKYGANAKNAMASRFREACFLSGVFLGAFGSGGPPVVLWTVSQSWNPKHSRAFYFGLSVFAAPVTLALLVTSLGSSGLDMIVTGISLSPVVLFCSWYGIRLGSRFKTERLNSLAISILVLGAMSAILKVVV